jgi:hypothetical protein
MLFLSDYSILLNLLFAMQLTNALANHESKIHHSKWKFNTYFHSSCIRVSKGCLIRQPFLVQKSSIKFNRSLRIDGKFHLIFCIPFIQLNVDGP